MSDSKKQSSHPITRRTFLKAATAAASLTAAACKDLGTKTSGWNPLASQSHVTILHASSYAKNLSDLLRQGMKNHTLDVRGKRVVLKPNLVEYHTAHRINTNPF